MKSVRDELAEALKIAVEGYNFRAADPKDDAVCGCPDICAPGVAALARHEAEPDPTPRLLALLKADQQLKVIRDGICMGYSADGLTAAWGEHEKALAACSSIVIPDTEPTP